MDKRAAVSDVKVYEFALFKQIPHMVHGIFTRQVETGPCQSGNIRINSKNMVSARENCRNQVARKMGPTPLVFLNQVHGDQITVLKKDDHDVSGFIEPGKEIEADAIITDMKAVCLVILVADCQAVIMYDPQKKIIANIHSGWRGSVKNIIGKCVIKMTRVFGCESENIIAGISPSLGPCCSEFINYTDEIPKKLWKYKIEDSDYFDFWKMSRDQLMETGVKKDHIENMKICTKCHTDVFYSFRGENTTGRFACVISMI